MALDLSKFDGLNLNFSSVEKSVVVRMKDRNQLKLENSELYFKLYTKKLLDHFYPIPAETIKTSQKPQKKKKARGKAKRNPVKEKVRAFDKGPNQKGFPKGTSCRDVIIDLFMTGQFYYRNMDIVSIIQARYPGASIGGIRGPSGGVIRRIIGELIHDGILKHFDLESNKILEYTPTPNESKLYVLCMPNKDKHETLPSESSEDVLLPEFQKPETR